MSWVVINNRKYYRVDAFKDILLMTPGEYHDAALRGRRAARLGARIFRAESPKVV